jgi:IS30 family transposase
MGSSEGFFPKKTDLSAITDREIKQVEQYLNDRPVRKFKY